VAEVAEKDNPAARLRSLLVELQQQPRNASVAAGWANVLDIASSPVDLGVLMPRLGAVHQLPTQILMALQNHPETANEPVFTEWVEPVKQALDGSLSLSAGLENVLRQYDSGAALTSLASVAFVLGRDGRRMPPEDQLADLLQQVRDFEAALMEEGIDERLRAFLLEHVRLMEHAIRMVRVRGNDALRDVAEQGLGAVLFATQEHGKDPLLRRMWSLTEKFAVLAGVGSGGIAIAQAVQAALP
jgi:hypothetical protein